MFVSMEQYASGAPAWVPFLLVVSVFVTNINRAMHLPLSSPGALALRMALVAVRFVAEWRVLRDSHRARPPMASTPTPH